MGSISTARLVKLKDRIFQLIAQKMSRQFLFHKQFPNESFNKFKFIKAKPHTQVKVLVPSIKSSPVVNTNSGLLHSAGFYFSDSEESVSVTSSDSIVGYSEVDPLTLPKSVGKNYQSSESKDRIIPTNNITTTLPDSQSIRKKIESKPEVGEQSKKLNIPPHHQTIIYSSEDEIESVASNDNIFQSKPWHKTLPNTPKVKDIQMKSKESIPQQPKHNQPKTPIIGNGNNVKRTEPSRMNDASKRFKRDNPTVHPTSDDSNIPTIVTTGYQAQQMPPTAFKRVSHIKDSMDSLYSHFTNKPPTNPTVSKPNHPSIPTELPDSFNLKNDQFDFLDDDFILFPDI
ncbi:hypothetical protein BC833DRAFT_586635 [Globomyces pollinis-pini]|nr:hypothetical protein BC833DRAFT_586635 [Globomyces pollinis-pini]